MKRASGSRNAAANATRTSTMVNGGSSLTATPTKKKEPPHSTDSASSSSHCVCDIGCRQGGKQMWDGVDLAGRHPGADPFPALEQSKGAADWGRP